MLAKFRIAKFRIHSIQRRRTYDHSINLFVVNFIKNCPTKNNKMFIAYSVGTNC
jgi:hypothetical protein